jgi:hypothetical protein
MFARRRVWKKSQGRSAVEKHTANTRKYGPGVIAYGNDTGPRGRYEHAYGTGVSSPLALRHSPSVQRLRRILRKTLVREASPPPEQSSRSATVPQSQKAPRASLYPRRPRRKSRPQRPPARKRAAVACFFSDPPRSPFACGPPVRFPVWVPASWRPLGTPMPSYRGTGRCDAAVRGFAACRSSA